MINWLNYIIVSLCVNRRIIMKMLLYLFIIIFIFTEFVIFIFTEFVIFIFTEFVIFMYMI